ncbi:putative phosphoglucomutase [Aspergillus homomorphus CBS 101889]|uniref:Putative phosphoglucomutase n=1 Tax=Aspergillus homomorphus (strain CBS 101889) TaxID=1450537 RepID=A0A395HVG2_ASPHC|nr:putative phosphoglucomutase [Aspergillus homomorphus CBS 101889]RAL11506.1 putative phosphoglucomutase [Aspergillus homomorphus CBS 101889]
MASLRDRLAYQPQPLKFGTSGRRGEVIHLTQLEIYTNVLAEIQYLLSLPLSEGGIRAGDDFYYAYDLRPSSTQYVENGRGALCQAVQQAVQDGGMNPKNLGAIPTPALTYYALKHGKGSIMVTGSHIPFDRNGYKLNTSKGELLKRNEAPINQAVERVREQLLSQPFAESIFNEQGVFRNPPQSLLPVLPEGRSSYIQRYLDFFQGETLQGMKLLAYQHSAVGRDLLVEVFEQLGAEVTPAGRSDTFVPIDTEAIDQAQLDTLEKLCHGTGKKFDAIISTDGDSDRPLLVAPDGDKLRFFGGDLLGMIVAQFLGVDAAVVPISSNDAIDRGPLAEVTEPKTKIGSPYVIEGMQRAALKGRNRVCGWEANGGFLTGSDIDRNGRLLTALPTRDAILPLLCTLFAAKQRQITLPELFATLPNRFSRAALIRNFPRPTSMKIIQRFSPSQSLAQEVSYNSDGTAVAHDADRAAVDITDGDLKQLDQIRRELQAVFASTSGFSPIARLNYTDGVRIIFANGDVAHFRPSGNADELRIYAVADSQERADAIAEQGVAEPAGLLRSLERLV